MSCYAKTNTMFVSGTTAVPVEIEVSIQPGLPVMTFVGGAMGSDTSETSERVRCAIRSCGFEMPQKRVVVNLSPRSVVKVAPSFDLAIAVAVLAASRQVPDSYADSFLVGELSLYGKVRPLDRGFLAIVSRAADFSRRVFASYESLDPASFGFSNAFGVENLDDFRATFPKTLAFTGKASGNAARVPDFAELPVSETVAKACQLSVLTGQSLLFVTPDQSLAKSVAFAMCGIMPDLLSGERLRAAIVSDCAGLDVSPDGRPFRAPHHSSTLAGIIGGGRPVRPGEVSLADQGVLFLQDVAEYRPTLLRQVEYAMHDKSVRIARADGVVEMPSDFLLVGSVAPCPCGRFGDSSHACTCSESAIMRYRDAVCRAWGRDDIRVDLAPCYDSTQHRPSSMLKDEVEGAIAFSLGRVLPDPPEEDRQMLAGLIGSATQVSNIARLARAAADLRRSDSISSDDLALALSFGRH